MSLYRTTHDLGHWYFHTMRVPWDMPVLQRDGTTHEVEEPWRIGHSWVLSLFSIAVVIGRWGEPRTLEDVVEAEGEIKPAPVVTEEIREQFREQPHELGDDPDFTVR